VTAALRLLLAEETRARDLLRAALAAAEGDADDPEGAGPVREDVDVRAWRQAVAALAGALESKDTGTQAHSRRVQRYAAELAGAVEPELLEDPSVEHGFFLHDVGKLGIPDRVLQKPAPLTQAEWRLMQTHTLVGHEMLARVASLRGDGVEIVRSHHERWDGNGYPDRMAGTDIPLGARVFAVADALDAITSDRPYRAARSWKQAAAEIVRESGRQFDPAVVKAASVLERRLVEIGRRLAARER
jgi:ribonuclease P protein subunit RPR2